MTRALALAAIEIAQGLTLATYAGLDIIKRTLNKRERTKEQARKMSDSMHRVMEMDG
jgi:hypothetical protein